MTTPNHEQPPTDVESRGLDDLLTPGSTLMVGTKSENHGEWDFRPLTVARVAGPDIDILLDTQEHWAQTFADGDAVQITLSDTRSNEWAHLVATGTITQDEALIDALWNPFAGAYFENGRDTPGIAVMRLVVARGRFWSTPSGRIGSLISMVAAAIGRDGAGTQHGDVSVEPNPA